MLHVRSKVKSALSSPAQYAAPPPFHGAAARQHFPSLIERRACRFAPASARFERCSPGHIEYADGSLLPRQQRRRRACARYSPMPLSRYQSLLETPAA